MNKIAPILIVLGAVSYGVTGVILDLARKHGFPINNIIIMMYLFSFLISYFLLCLNTRNQNYLTYKENIIFFISGAFNIAITYCFYSSLTYVGVPTATLFLMQSAWITPFISFCIQKKIPNPSYIISMLLVILGVIVATYSNHTTISWMGIVWGVGSAISYSLMLIFSSYFGKEKNVFGKLTTITFGAFIISIFLFKDYSNIVFFSYSSVWSLLYAIFASILPILLLSLAMPKVSTDLAGILITLEIPAAYILSYFLLSEHIYYNQIIGCLIIIITIIFPKLYKIIYQK